MVVYLEKSSQILRISRAGNFWFASICKVAYFAGEIWLARAWADARKIWFSLPRDLKQDQVSLEFIKILGIQIEDDSFLSFK